MPVVRLHGPLKRLAGGQGEHDLQGVDVGELLRALERRHGALAGWILDERGAIRPHMNVFVNGERCGEQAALKEGDHVEILPAISGGGASTSTWRPSGADDDSMGAQR